MKAIYKRELRSHFQNMTGCVFIAFLTAYVGIYFMVYNLNFGYPYFSYTLSGALFIILLAIPILTMRSFAEERKNRTDQLLLTSPVPLGAVVMGKYLSMVTVFAIPMAIFCCFPLIIRAQGTAYFKVDYCSILLYFLMGCVYISIGMFLSALTESQIIAVITTFGVLLIVYLWDALLQFLPSGLKSLLGNLSVVAVFSDAAENRIFHVSGVVLYLSLIGLFLFLTMQSIQKRRWS